MSGNYPIYIIWEKFFYNEYTYLARALIELLSNLHFQKGQTPMHCACAEEHLDAVEALIGLGANVDAQDNDGNTPLHVATRTRHTGIAQLLLKAGANTELIDAVNY